MNKQDVHDRTNGLAYIISFWPINPDNIKVRITVSTTLQSGALVFRQLIPYKCYTLFIVHQQICFIDSNWELPWCIGSVGRWFLQITKGIIMPNLMVAKFELRPSLKRSLPRYSSPRHARSPCSSLGLADRVCPAVCPSRGNAYS